MGIQKQIVEKNLTNFHQELLQFSGLPDEIIIEILLRLPVKSLLKLRCVSKSWLSLLSSSHFMKTQIRFSVKESKNVNIRLLVVASGYGLAGKICSIYSIVCENSHVDFARSDYPLKLPFRSASFLGSCNGLICLTPMSFELMLWNPTTGKYKEFQDSIFHSSGSCYIRYGFGYDATNDDYKVVKIFSFPRDEGRYENVVKIFSLRGDSWKIGEGFNSGYVNAQSGVFLNGNLHWELSDSRGSGCRSEIMALDLATETYGVMRLPDCEKGNVSWTLSVLGGHLFAGCNYYPNRTEMWVMKEYGVEKSWTKLVSLLSPPGRMGYVSPLFVSENGGEVLAKLGTDISLYSTRNASYKSFGIHSAGCRLQVQAITYTESLASPHLGRHRVACCNYSQASYDTPLVGWKQPFYLSQVVRWTAYNLPSPDPNMWEYTGTVDVVVVAVRCPVIVGGYILPLFVSENGDECLVKLGTDKVFSTRGTLHTSPRRFMPRVVVFKYKQILLTLRT